MNVVIVQQDTVDEIRSEHFARPQSTFPDDVFFVVVVNTDFGRDGQVTILRDHESGRPQAVAIQAAGRITAIGQHDAGRAVPGLHLAVVELVECPYVGVDVVNRLPGRGHENTHCLDDVHAAGTQHFEHIVEAR